MFRYLAFVRDDSKTGGVETLRQLRATLLRSGDEWTDILSNGDLAVYCADLSGSAAEVCPLPGQHGVILGTLFRRDATPNSSARLRVDEFGADEARRVVDSAGQHLIEHYWGQYVALFQEPAAGTCSILRGPTGALPCFRAASGGVHVFSSDPNDCLRLGLQLKIDWDALTYRLMSDGAGENGVTCIDGLQPVHAGERVVLRQGTVESSFAWDPFRFALDPIGDMDSAVATVGRLVKHCIGAWASCYDGVLHRLSGGLDSSLVLSCLAKSGVRVTCINHHSLGADTDERRFARLAAKHVQCDLVESERDPCVTLKALERVARTAQPSPYIYSLHYGRVEAATAKARGARAIFSGELGDAIFFHQPSLDVAADYVHDFGLSRRLFSVALDVARVDGVSIVHALLNGVLKGWRRRGVWNPGDDEALRRSRTLVSSAVRDGFKQPMRFLHPWLRHPQPIGPAKFLHIYVTTILAFQQFYDPLGETDDPQIIAPLVSQPLIEECLRIPMHLHIQGGWGRSVARRAFIDSVPQEIIVRRTKGGVDHYAKNVLKSERAFVREFLLDGELIKRRLLNRAGLEQVLSDEPSNIRSMIPELYWYLSVEAWVRAWLSQERTTFQPAMAQSSPLLACVI